MAYTGKKIETKLYDVFTKEEAIQNSTPSAVSDKTNTSTGYFDLPAGTTAERPASPATGMLRFNTQLDQLEQYTTDGWKGISAPPTITNTDTTVIDADLSTQTIVITGQNFDVGATGLLVDANNNTKLPTTSTRDSSSQITIVYSGGDVLDSSVPDPLTVKVINGSGLSGLLEGQLNINATPVWNTAAGSILTTSDRSAASTSVSASDLDSGDTITYTVTSGALPSGMSLNSSTGSITGTPNDVSGNTTSNFTITADDGTEQIPRAFNATITKRIDGSSSDRAGGVSSDIDGYYFNTSRTAYLTLNGNYSPIGIASYYDGSGNHYVNVNGGYTNANTVGTEGGNGSCNQGNFNYWVAARACILNGRALCDLNDNAQCGTGCSHDARWVWQRNKSGNNFYLKMCSPAQTTTANPNSPPSTDIGIRCCVPTTWRVG
jgi:hypothetical protein